MREIRIGAAQFEHRDNDKAYNLDRIASLTGRAVAQGAEVVSFHECAITGYTFLQTLDRPAMEALAEPVPDGPSTQHLVQIARDYGTVVMAGLVEIDAEGRLFNTYVTVAPEGYVTKFSKLHPFVSPHLSPGPGYNVRELLGCQAGWLICYDNNLPENNRLTAMLGAEIIFMPHVTGCLPSPMPGRGPVEPVLWDRRHTDPVPLRMEFEGPKGFEWLMKFIPTRCYENGVYGVFSNPIGRDYDTIKPGLAMIIDPFGEIIARCHALDDDVCVATCTPEKLELASGRRYLRARRPELYGPMVEPQESQTLPGWTRSFEK